MYRSFTDRVLGGVCGGLGAVTPLGAWTLRVMFVGLALVTLGAFALLYLGLWMTVPQQSLAMRQRGGAGLLLLVFLAIMLTIGGWVAWITTGTPLYWPLLLLAVSAVFFLRQLKG
jgi:phage shock protein PspC (stress-responsive transcriptional regulator)